MNTEGLSKEIVWDSIPQNLKIEEYFNYYDLGNPDENFNISSSDYVLVLSHKSIEDAINDNLFDEDAAIVPFDKSAYKYGKFSAYVVQNDIPDRNIKKGDCLILDINHKGYKSKGLYIILHDNRYYIKYMDSANSESEEIVAKVCELRRRKFN